MQRHQLTWYLTFLQDKFLQSAESCRNLSASTGPRLFTQKVLTCSISRSSCWIISSNKAWKRFCEGRGDKQDLFESTRWASLNCDGFKCVSACALLMSLSPPWQKGHLECQSETADLFPATVIITTGDGALTLPKHRATRALNGNVKRAKSARVLLIVVSTKESSEVQWIFRTFFPAWQCVYSKALMGEM